MNVILRPWTLLLSLLILAGCYDQEAHNESNNKKIAVNFSHPVSGVVQARSSQSRSSSPENLAISARSDFNNVPFLIPGSTPQLISSAMGPFDFSGTTLLHFDVIYTSPDDLISNFTVVLDQYQFADSSNATSVEIASIISTALAGALDVSDSPLTITGFENGGTIELIPVMETGITLSDIGFGLANRLAAGVLDVASADLILFGTMTVTNVATGIWETFEWNAYLDTTLFIAKSTTTALIESGEYHFRLDLEDIGSGKNYRYTGEATQTISENNDLVPITLSPVISDLSLSTAVAEQTLPSTLTRYFIGFPSSELATITSPELGISINGGAEVIYTQSQMDGTIETFLDLTPGSNTIELNLYSQGTLKGVSLDSQETQNITAGQNITMDIVPLTGVVEADLTESGGTLNISSNVPQSVLDEVGGLANLSGMMTIESPKNGNLSAAITLDGFEPSVTANATVTDVQFDTVKLTVLFTETDTGDLVATCTLHDLNLDSLSIPPHQCDLNLRKKSLLTGNLMASVGLSVVSDQNEPVNGAIIKDTATNEVLGVTGTATFGTQGFAALNLTEGSHSLTITSMGSPFGDLSGSTFITVVPLEIKNLTVPLLPVSP